MKPVADHVHPDPAIAPIRGECLETGDIMLPGDVFASKRDGWKYVHQNWHGVRLEALSANEDVVVRPASVSVPPTPPSTPTRGRLLKRNS